MAELNDVEVDRTNVNHRPCPLELHRTCLFYDCGISGHIFSYRSDPKKSLTSSCTLSKMNCNAHSKLVICTVRGAFPPSAGIVTSLILPIEVLTSITNLQPM
jgi:hypothetical protein